MEWKTTHTCKQIHHTHSCHGKLDSQHSQCLMTPLTTFRFEGLLLVSIKQQPSSTRKLGKHFRPQPSQMMKTLTMMLPMSMTMKLFTHQITCGQTHFFGVNPDTEENAAIVEDLTLLEDSQTLLDWHYKLRHTSFKTMQHMAELGLIPRKLKGCHVRKYPAYIYVKQKRCTWCTKSKPALIGKTVNKPGQCVSVD